MILTMNNNYDSKEIKHFSHLANDWWDTNGSLRTLHDINPVRLNFILQHTTLQNKKILDVGCGGGILSEALAKEGAIVTGIDLESNAIQAAMNHAENQNLSIQYQCVAIETLLEKSERYDVITCMEMLEHVPHPEQIIQACVALLKPDGKLFLSTINRTWKAYGLAIVAAEYLLNLVPKNTHQYDRFIKPSEIADWLRPKGLSVKAFSGVDYNPCSHVASFSESLDVNYLVFAEKH